MRRVVLVVESGVGGRRLPLVRQRIVRAPASRRDRRSGAWPNRGALDGHADVHGASSILAAVTTAVGEDFEAACRPSACAASPGGALATVDDANHGGRARLGARHRVVHAGGPGGLNLLLAPATRGAGTFIEEIAQEALTACQPVQSAAMATSSSRDGVDCSMPAKQLLCAQANETVDPV